jgi:rhodanese-related sulfurtransferase
VINTINNIDQLSPTQAFDLLAHNSNAQLIDVRTEGEWQTIGVPDLHSVNKKVHTISWRLAPDMALNTEFDTACEVLFSQLNITKDTPLLFLCKGGTRSQHAAEHFAQKGYQHCMNIEGGFQGKTPLTPGWEALGLPKGHYA